MRARVLTVAGGAVTGAARVDGESGVWAITVTPDTREALSITLALAADCEADAARSAQRTAEPCRSGRRTS